MRIARTWVLGTLVLGFAVVSGIALAKHGYVGLWRWPFRDAAGVQLFCDLAIALLLVTSWMLRDARASGVPAAPYLALTVAAGSFGPLLYLLHRELRAGRRAPDARVA